MAISKRSPDKSATLPELKEFPEKFQQLLKSTWTAFATPLNQSILLDWLQIQKEAKLQTPEEFEKLFLKFLEAEFRKNQNPDIGKGIAYANGLLDKQLNQNAHKILADAQIALTKDKEKKSTSTETKAVEPEQAPEFQLLINHVRHAIQQENLSDSLATLCSAAKTKLDASTNNIPIEIHRLVAYVQGVLDSKTNAYSFTNLSKTQPWYKGFVYPDGNYSYYLIRMLHEIGEIYRVTTTLQYARYDQSIDKIDKILQILHSESELKKTLESITTQIQERKQENLSDHVARVEKIYVESYNSNTVNEVIKNLENNAYDAYVSEAWYKADSEKTSLPAYMPKKEDILNPSEHKTIDSLLTKIAKDIANQSALTNDFQVSHEAEKLQAIKKSEDYIKEQTSLLERLENHIYTHFFNPNIPELKIPGLPISKSERDIRSEIELRSYLLDNLESTYKEKLQQAEEAQKIFADEKESFPRGKKEDTDLITSIRLIKPVYDEFIKKSTAGLKQNAMSVTKEQYNLLYFLLHGTAWAPVFNEVSTLPLDDIQKNLDKIEKKINFAVTTEQQILKQITEEKACITKQRECLLKLAELAKNHTSKRLPAFQKEINARKTSLINQIADCKTQLSLLRSATVALKKSISKKPDITHVEKIPELKAPPSNDTIEYTNNVIIQDDIITTIPDHKLPSWTSFTNNEKIALGAGSAFGTTGTALGIVGFTALTNIWNPIGWGIVLGIAACLLISSAVYGAYKVFGSPAPATRPSTSTPLISETQSSAATSAVGDEKRRDHTYVIAKGLSIPNTALASKQPPSTTVAPSRSETTLTEQPVTVRRIIDRSPPIMPIMRT